MFHNGAFFIVVNNAARPYTPHSLHTYAPHGLGMWRVCVRRWGCIGSCWGNRREGDRWGDLGVDGWIILGWITRRWDVGI